MMFRRIQHVHFVGIGGIGMCGIAELLAGQGCRVTGSDLREGPTVARLRALGVEVSVGHASQHVGQVVVPGRLVGAVYPVAGARPADRPGRGDQLLSHQEVQDEYG